MTYIKLKNKKIAIIGGGISGLSAAYFLANKYNVSLYEKSGNLGGHAITLRKKLYDINNKKKNIFFDIGFLVYNKKNYPNFTKLLESILVETEKSNMSFSVSNKYSKFEYGSTGILSLTNNFKNILSLDFYSILLEIFKFYRVSKNFLKKENENISLKDFLSNNKFNKSLVHNHIIPMCAAIWSTSSQNVFKMPAKNILKFLDNHGLLSLLKKPQWRTISNGSINYVKELEKRIKGRIFKNEEVIKVERSKKKVYVHSKNYTKAYDKIIFAVHADDILKLLDSPTKKEKKIFSKYKYEENLIFVHHDENFMPRSKNVWSSWNVIVNDRTSKAYSPICVTYWINKLQNFYSKNQVLVTLNPPNTIKINKKKILKILKLKHPLLEKEHFSLSKEVNKLQGHNMTYFTGAWLGYGFHEDGLNSSINVANYLSKKAGV